MGEIRWTPESIQRNYTTDKVCLGFERTTGIDFCLVSFEQLNDCYHVGFALICLTFRTLTKPS